MDTVPRLDRTRPIYRDDPVISRLTDEEVWAVARVLARLATATARRLGADGVTSADIEAHGLDAAIKLAAERRASGEAEPEAAPAPARKRVRRPSPRRLTKWEAQWQAEQADGEAES